MGDSNIGAKAMKMSETRAREISRSKDLSKFKLEELAAASRYVKDAALKNLSKHLKQLEVPKELRDFILMMAKVDYDTVEVDTLLSNLKCYPEWVKL